jgi:hypothetical protein
MAGGVSPFHAVEKIRKTIGSEKKMNTNTNLDRRSLGELIRGMFESGNPEVYLRDTDPGENARKFASAHELNGFIDTAIEAHRLFVGFAVWYPETRGHVEKRKINLDPRRCEGHTFRYSIKGWGMISVQLDFENLPLINCCVSCSSRKKGEVWSDAHRDLKSPSLWDWGVVERHCRRLMGLTKELEKRMVQGNAPPDSLHPPRL